MKQLSKTIKKQSHEAQNTFNLGKKIKHSLKDVWKYVKSKSESGEVIPYILDGVNHVVDNKAKAQIFNHYFQSVVSEPVAAVADFKSSNSLMQMTDIEFTEHGIGLLFQKIKVHSASGPDRISNFILKNCAASIAPFLTTLFRTSFEQGALPSDWKWANVIPIYKSGKKTITYNYRPISLTSVCCKTLEHIIYTNLMSHLNSNKFFFPKQYGFRAGFSCNTQLIQFTHDIASSVNSGKQIDCIFLDFRRAFDMISHILLLQKLSVLNIPPKLMTWIEAYLLDGVSLSDVNVLSGVLQGSLLGPLLFLVFINDLTETISS